MSIALEKRAGNIFEMFDMGLLSSSIDSDGNNINLPFGIKRFGLVFKEKHRRFGDVADFMMIYAKLGIKIAAEFFAISLNLNKYVRLPFAGYQIYLTPRLAIVLGNDRIALLL